MLEKSPHPLKYSLAILLFVFLTLTFHSVLTGILLGLTIGLYFGNYYGRSSVMDAWLNELKRESETYDEKLTSLEETERERIQRQAVCSDETHWQH